MLILCASVLIINTVYYQYSSSVPLAVTTHHSTAAYAILLTLNGVLIVLFELPLTAITRRYRWRIPMAIGIMLISIGIVFSGVFRPYPLIAVGIAFFTTGEMFYGPVVNAAVADISPPGRIGRYQGYLSMVQTIGLSIGPAIGVFAYSYKPAVLWAGCLTGGIIACAGILAAGRPAEPEHGARPHGRWGAREGQAGPHITRTRPLLSLLPRGETDHVSDAALPASEQADGLTPYSPGCAARC